MKTGKEQVLDLMEKLPDDVSAETILTELEFTLLLRRRGEDAELGQNLVSHEDAKKRLSRWLNSTGT
jgi:hypothetical protein